MSLLAAALSLLGAATAAGPPLVDCGLAPGWTLDGAPRAYEPDELFDYMNGNAESYRLYRFVRMRGITCRSGEATIVIDVSEMATPDYAYGIFMANRDPRQPLATIGMAGQTLRERVTFAKDRYYVELAVHGTADGGTAAAALARAIESGIAGRNTPPGAVTWFPAEGLVPDSVRLVPESVLGLRLLEQGWVAQYEQGKAFVVPADSPEAAAAVFARLKARVGRTTALASYDEGFSGVDRYLDGLYVVRRGRYLAGFAGLKDGADPSAAVKALLERLPSAP